MPSTSTIASTARKSLTSSQNPRRTSGNASRKAGHEKNVSRTSGQPWLVRMTVASVPSTTTVETALTTAARRV
jgi:hypothetical protein